MEIPDKLTVAHFSVGFMSRGWQRLAITSLVDCGRVVDAGNKLDI